MIPRHLRVCRCLGEGSWTFLPGSLTLCRTVGIYDLGACSCSYEAIVGGTWLECEGSLFWAVELPDAGLELGCVQ